MEEYKTINISKKSLIESLGLSSKFKYLVFEEDYRGTHIYLIYENSKILIEINDINLQLINKKLKDWRIIDVKLNYLRRSLLTKIKCALTGHWKFSWDEIKHFKIEMVKSR